MSSYVLWDWNGTLLDDVRPEVAALNTLLAERGLPPIDIAFFREQFSYPVRPFYERLGLYREGEDWQALASAFHRLYYSYEMTLHPEALAILRALRERGVGQSIISAHRQDLLTRDVVRLGVAPFMEHVCGSDNLDGASKLDRALELLAALRARPCPPDDIVVIGDSFHDFDVARRLGVRVVLHGEGTHSAGRLKAVAPAYDTLREAVHAALGF